jgi:colicin import membrane protein
VKSLRLAAAALALGGVALARDGRADDRAAAESLLRTVEHASVGDAVKNARDALERATRMRVAGDEAHARLAEGLALEWAEAARDLARTVEVETQTRARETAAMEAKARVEREQALLEDAIARSGRLKVELATATAKGGPGGAKKDRTSTVSASPAKTLPKAPGKSKASPPPAADADAPVHEVDGAAQGRP